jgi:phage tail sheath gpL-like
MTVEGSPARDSQSAPERQLRAGHVDRDAVVEVLRVAAGDGRLTPAELDERLEAALTAKTYSELAILTADLPAAGQASVTATAPAKDLVRIDCRSGSARRDGPWAVPRRIEARVTSGSIKLDLTHAIIAHPDLEVDVSVRSGSVTLVTRPGIEVDAEDVAVRSGSVTVRQHRGPAVPIILRVRVSGQVGSGSFKARPPRRTFLAWLLRQPLVYS